jgi:acyl-CoA thioesterase
VPQPEALRSYRELAGAEYDEWYPIWRSIEGRPVRWRDGPGRPEWHTWLRFTDTPIPDRHTDALRQLFWVDFPGWNAAISAHTWPFRYLAPNLDLGIQFHRFAPGADWVLAEGEVPLAQDGLLGCVARLWTAGGELLATGTSRHVCRRNPRYEEECERARALGLIPADS